MQVKITPKMVRAGQRALADHPRKEAITEELVCAVWKAMAAKCPPIEIPIPEGTTPELIVIQLS